METSYCVYHYELIGIIFLYTLNGIYSNFSRLRDIIQLLIHTTKTSKLVGTCSKYYTDSVHKSILCDIDPDLNYLNNISKSEYYDETIFNQSFRKTSNFSLTHLNIRSVPLHFTQCMSYLDTLDIDFKIISLSETTINSSHINYNIPNYNVDINFRKKKKGGGVSLYIPNQLQYKLRNDLQLEGDVNSVFVEIPKSSRNTKYNVICGCVYRPRFMSLKTFNEQI